MGERSASRINNLNDPNAQDAYTGAGQRTRPYTVNERMQADEAAADRQSDSSTAYEEDTIVYGEGDADDAGTDDDEDTGDPDAIRDDIEQTRNEMSGTIDAIQEKLNPQRITRQVTESVKEATIGRAEDFMSDMGQRAQGIGSSLGDTLRENWIPATMIGIGLGWLLFRNGANRQGSRNAYYARGYGYGRSDYPNAPNPADYQARAYGTSSQRDSLQQGMRQGVRKAGQAMNQAQDNIGDTMDSMQEKMGQMGGQARYQAQQAQGWLTQAFNDHPLTLGAMALAAGVAVAMAIPETEQENEWMGQTRDTMLQQAESAAQDTLQKTQQVAKRAANAATGAAQDEAQKQQLTH